jgi:hypothetical protein
MWYIHPYVPVFAVQNCSLWVTALSLVCSPHLSNFSRVLAWFSCYVQFNRTLGLKAAWTCRPNGITSRKLTDLSHRS